LSPTFPTRERALPPDWVSLIPHFSLLAIRVRSILRTDFFFWATNEFFHLGSSLPFYPLLFVLVATPSFSPGFFRLRFGHLTPTRIHLRCFSHFSYVPPRSPFFPSLPFVLPPFSEIAAFPALFSSFFFFFSGSFFSFLRLVLRARSGARAPGRATFFFFVGFVDHRYAMPGR